MTASILLFYSWPPWDGGLILAACCAGVASVALCCLRPRSSTWLIVVSAVGVAAGLALPRSWASTGGVLQKLALACALNTLLWSASAAVVNGGRAGTGRHSAVRARFARTAHVVALLLGVVTAIIQSVTLMTRVIYAGLEIVNGTPNAVTMDYGFGPEGLLSLALIFGACAISLAVTGDRRLGACQLICAVTITSWSCLLMPVLRHIPGGGFERTGTVMVLTVALSVVLALSIRITGWAAGRRQPRFTAADDPRAPAETWPGMSPTVAVTAVSMVLLVCYLLAVPVPAPYWGYHGSSLMVAGAAALGALACFQMVYREWSVHLADAGLALTSLGLCAIATLFVPSQPVSLAHRYPMVFNAIMLGLVSATALWTHLALRWQRASSGAATTPVTARMVSSARRFAFHTATMAMVVGVVMAVWPRWPGIATMDDSMGRLTAGLAVNLLAVWVLLWCARRTRKVVYQILTMLALANAFGFLFVRGLPFTPRFG